MDMRAGLTFTLVGSTSLLTECAERLLERGHHLVQVLATDPDVTRWCEIRGVRIVTSLQSMAMQSAHSNCDYLLSIGNDRLLPKTLLDAADRLAINYHDGPLPALKGLYVPSWAIMAQRPEHAVTWHVMTAEVDGGDVLASRRFPIEMSDNAFSLNGKCFEAALETFAELLDQLEQGAERPLPQDAGGGRCYGRWDRPEAACLIDWNQPGRQVGALVRALEFGPYANPLGSPKIMGADNAVVVRELELLNGSVAERASPGTLIDLSDDGLTIVCNGGAVRARVLADLDGTPISPLAAAQQLGIVAGEELPALSGTEGRALSGACRTAARAEAFWRQRLADLSPWPSPFRRSSPGTSLAVHRIEERLAPLSGGSNEVALNDVDQAMLLWGIYLARVADVCYYDAAINDVPVVGAGACGDVLFSTQVPFRVEIDVNESVATNLRRLSDSLTQTHSNGHFLWDLLGRYPELETVGREDVEALAVVSLARAATVPDRVTPAGSGLSVHWGDDGRVVWTADACTIDPTELRSLVAGYKDFRWRAHHSAQTALRNLPTVADAVAPNTDFWRMEGFDRPSCGCIHELVDQQAIGFPDRPAVVAVDGSICYAELRERSDRLARELITRGVAADARVGVLLERTLNLPVTLLAVLKAGAAYLPLDPSWPQERLELMVDDAQPELIVARPEHSHNLAKGRYEFLDPREVSANDDHSIALPEVAGDAPAYVIYTSGSTGTPKGVVVNHGNLSNFVVGMDEVIGERAGTWLAVTSLSFDISILELLWTLARGFQVVVHTREEALESEPRAPVPSPRGHLDFSLFYFASADDGNGRDNYRLLMEGARYADNNGFQAVWTPERHFHAFGGLYPNPSVASAAIAAITENIEIRAGSCVIPLHHPLRVAEEWSLVDNLSDGRVGVSFACGWQPVDFVLAPEKFADRKTIMYRDIELVKRLWRGESVAFEGPDGITNQVRIHPRPVQAELPVWVTAAGNPETFKEAGASGANLLTHLLGQTLEELGEKIEIYRKARHEAGYAGAGKITLMLHTLVAESDQRARELAREPMKAYLRSAVGLIKAAAWTFPTFRQKAIDRSVTPDQLVDEDSLSPKDMEALLEHAFNRYFETSGLFGTPATCIQRLEDISALGVDEVACLIDFGVPSSEVLAALPRLKELKDDFNSRDSGQSRTVAMDMDQHGVSHLQCTPSMAKAQLLDPDFRAALPALDTLLLGGEPLSREFAEELRAAGVRRLLNMYGPTETTIWSSVQEVDESDLPIVPIGRPIANTKFYVLDSLCQPRLPGAAGELFIGGAGVASGYRNRQLLTEERFPRDMFADSVHERMYRTGDRVRMSPDGTLEFLGRFDHQVKIRGHRVELGEVEAQLGRVKGIDGAVCVVVLDPFGDTQLVACLRAASAQTADAETVRSELALLLPEYMVPSRLLFLEDFPLGPNGKLDRIALQNLASEQRPQLVARALPEGALENLLGDIWAAHLQVEGLDVNANFFSLGGNSLLAMRVVASVRELLGIDLSLSALFRAPSVRQFGEEIEASTSDRLGLERRAQIAADVLATPEEELDAKLTAMR